MTLLGYRLCGTPFTSEGADPLAGNGIGRGSHIFLYLFNFPCTATTPLVAKRAWDYKNKDTVAVGGAKRLALGLGATVTMTLLTFRRPLLRIMDRDNR
jgi:Na+-driven multidrug efflux pump